MIIRDEGWWWGGGGEWVKREKFWRDLIIEQALRASSFMDKEYDYVLLSMIAFSSAIILGLQPWIGRSILSKVLYQIVLLKYFLKIDNKPHKSPFPFFRKELH